MLKTIIGKINKIKLLRETETYRLTLIVIDDLEVTTFDKGIADHFNEEDVVKCEYEETEKYTTLKSIKIYNEEAENKLNEYLKENKLDVQEVLTNDIFSNKFKIGTDSYRITISKI